MQSELWMQFATIVFVLFFVVDCSMIFLRLYRKGLDQLDELRLERDKARAAYEVKSQFVSTVSHELRTPLTSILGALGLMTSDIFTEAPERAEKVLNIAYKNSKRLSNLIDDLLDLQKLESGHMTYGFNPIDLSETIGEAIESIGGFAETSGIQIKADIVEESVVVMADHDRVLQVLANLLSNAVKFSNGADRVEIQLSKDHTNARISVRDFGIGIPEHSRNLVFGKFRQVDSSGHRKHRGTGLGMSITEQIMIAHGGKVDYASTLGEGTVFYLEFPLN